MDKEKDFDQIGHLSFIKELIQHEQRSDKWFSQREQHLTSSDAATALGINPYKKPIELLFEKCGFGKTFTGNESTLHGQKYETEAIEKYSMLMGKRNHEFGMISYKDINPIRKHLHLINPDYHFLGGSPDGIAEDTSNIEPLVMLEVKCPMRRKIKHGQIPEYYYPQVQLNMFILNLDIADFIEYIPAYSGKTVEMNIVRVHRCEEWFNKNFPILDSFWKSVLYWKEKGIENHPEYDKYYKKVCKPDKPIPDYLFVDTGEPTPTSEPSVIEEECMFT